MLLEMAERKPTMQEIRCRVPHGNLRLKTLITFAPTFSGLESR
jgi:hypothetical protein